jgi:hypothetical protein
MPYTIVSERKRKQTAEVPEPLFSSSGQSKSKARRVSTDAQEATHAVTSDKTTEEALTAATAASTTIAPPQDSMESIGQLIQDLFRSDNAKVHASLAALELDLVKNKKKCVKIQAVGGCLALVQLLNKCLDKAMMKIPQCDQVTELNELAKVTTLNKTLRVIISLTFRHEESRVSITAVGGVEAVVKVMKTFPKCQTLQECGCGALQNVMCKNVSGKKKVVENGGIEVVLAAVNNHSGSANVCEFACMALFKIVNGSKENTGLLISLCGGAAVAKVRTKWPDNNDVQYWVRELANLIASEMNSWADDE